MPTLDENIKELEMIYADLTTHRENIETALKAAYGQDDDLYANELLAASMRVNKAQLAILSAVSHSKAAIEHALSAISKFSMPLTV